MNQPIQPAIPRRFAVIVGVVDPKHPTLPVEHFDAVRKAVNEIVPRLLSHLGIDASLVIELGRDDQLHYLDVTLVASEVSSEGFLFGSPKPSGDLPADAAHALTAEARALIYTLMTEGSVSIGELCESDAEHRKDLNVPLKIAQAIRKAPGARVVLQANGVQHQLDLGVLGGIVELDRAVQVSAIVRAIGPKAAFLEHMRFAALPNGLKFPRSGWLTLPRNTLPATIEALEKACKEECRHSLTVRLWIHRLHRTVRTMHPASTGSKSGDG